MVLSHTSHNQKLKTLAALIASMLLTVGCATSIKESNNQSADKAVVQIEKVIDRIGDKQTPESVRGGKQYADKQAAEQMAPDLVKKTSRSWVGATMVPITTDDRLPAIFNENFTFNFSDNGKPVSLGVMASRLSRIVSLPVRIQPDVFEGVGRDNAQRPAQAPRGLPALDSSAVLGGSSNPLNVSAQESSAPLTKAIAFTPEEIQMEWDGTLVGYLNHITDRLGLSWEYRDNTIVIMRFLTEYYELATFPNGYSYSMTSGGNSSGSGEGVNSTAGLSVSERGDVNSFTATLEIIKQMLDAVPGSTVVTADGSGRIMVRTTRDMQAMVRDFIKSENDSMLKQAQIQMDIYSVTLNQDNEMGVDLSYLFESKFGKVISNGLSPGSLTSALAGQVNISVFENGRDQENSRHVTNAILSALNEVGTNVQYRPVSLLALNRQWARKSRLTTQGYLAETTPAAAGGLGGGTSVPGLRTDEIVTGDQYVAMPYILQNNTILLKFGVALSDLVGLFDVTTGSGATLQKVQTPNINSVNDQYTVALRPGEVMAITGISRESTGETERTLGEKVPILAGGSVARNRTKEHFVIMIRSVIL